MLITGSSPICRGNSNPALKVYNSKVWNYVFTMKAIKHITVGVALLLLAGCATTFRPWKLSEVKEGMDRKQVVAVLGEPDSVEMKDGMEIMHYSYSEDYNPPPASGLGNQPIDSPERQMQDQQIKRSVQEHKYIVKLVGGKVQDYKELSD